jgi:hypothetical protein
MSEQPQSAGTTRRGRVPAAAPLRLTKLVQTKIIVPRGPALDRATLERERLVASLLAAQGRIAVTQTTEALLAAGHSLPDDQEAHLQVLEHADEARVRSSLAALDAILSREPARRRPVLEQRLKRIEELAEETATRESAAALRRKL